MSRSKEGLDKEKNTVASRQAQEPSKSDYLDERLGAKGQTDYSAGRESWREYPRRSTSLRGRNERAQSHDLQSRELQSRDLYDSPSRGDYGNRGVYDGATRYDRENRYESEPYGRYGRHSYNDLRYGRADHEDLPIRQGRYRANERGFDYARDNYRRDNYGRDNYRPERRQYDEPYNREALSGRYDYDRAYETRGESYDYRPSSELRNDWRGREANYLRASDIMTKNVTLCSPQTMLRDVAEKMQDDGIGSIPVVENGRLVGIVTDRDIVCRVIADGRDTRSTPAATAMSEDLVTCGPDDSAHEVIRKMGEHQIRRIPVCDMNGRLRGIIAMADIALEAERDRELADALEQISQPTPNRSRRV